MHLEGAGGVEDLRGAIFLLSMSGTSDIFRSTSQDHLELGYCSFIVGS
jgi:hypothetical protein